MTTLITPLPTPPTRQDSFNFNDRADDFLGALPLFQQEANGLAIDVQASAYDVEIARQAVVSTANVTKWVSDTTYAQGTAVWSPINGVTYRKMTSSTGGTTDPSLDSVNYKSITDAAGIIYNPNGTSAVETTVQEKLREVVSVKDFGAVGDGSWDDTAAFNAMTSHIRTLIVSGDALTTTIGIVIPPGSYSISSWNLTNLIGRQIDIHCSGARLVARTAGKAVVDAINSRWVRIHDLTIYSSSTTMARCGVQIGVSSEGLTCGNNLLDNVMCIGYFGVAPLLNLGSETTQYVGSTFENRNTDPGAYAGVFDGAAVRFMPQSDYVTVSRTQYASVSFSHNSASGTQFRNTGGGSAVYLSATNGFEFLSSSYVLSLNDSGFVLEHGSSYNRNIGLTLSTQYENTQNDNPTIGNTGIKYAIKMIGSAVSTSVEQLTIDVRGPMCEEALIYDARGGGALRLSNLLLRTVRITGGDTVPVYFKTSGGTLLADGRIEVQDAAKLNLGALDGFTGTIHVDDASVLPSRPLSGSYILTDRTAGAIYLCSENSNQRVSVYNSLVFFDGAGDNANGRLRAKGIGTMQIGNEQNATALQVEANLGAISGVAVTAQSTFPRIRPLTSLTNCDLQLEAKGDGYVRFGTRTASSDVPITGYIEIKDETGTIRKLALIS